MAALQVADDNGVRTIRLAEVDLDKYITDWRPAKKATSSRPRRIRSVRKAGAAQTPTNANQQRSRHAKRSNRPCEQLLKQHAHEE